MGEKQVSCDSNGKLRQGVEQPLGECAGGTNWNSWWDPTFKPLIKLSVPFSSAFPWESRGCYHFFPLRGCRCYWGQIQLSMGAGLSLDESVYSVVHTEVWIHCLIFAGRTKEHWQIKVLYLCAHKINKAMITRRSLCEVSYWFVWRQN